MTRTFHTIILGLGAAGSATLYQLARRGDRVLGIDQFSPPHSMGSSHGETRITRQSIGEGLQYTPLVLRSNEIFRAMEEETGEKLLTITGGLMLSSPGGAGIHNVADFFGNVLQAAKKYGIEHQVLEAKDIRRRFPQFLPDDHDRGFYEPGAGILHPEKCLDVQLKLAEKHGAEIFRNTKVTSFRSESGGVRLDTTGGEVFAERMVLAAGPWIPGMIAAEIASLFIVERQVQFWFDISKCYESFKPGVFPVFIWEHSGGRHPEYGFPAVDGPAGGLKIGTSGPNTVVTPETIDRNVSQNEMEIAYKEQVAPFFSGDIGPCFKTKVCLYTSTPDGAFVIDRMPDWPSVILCSPCSGHGFKHSAAIGEAISQMILDGETKLDLSSFKLSRFALPAFSGSYTKPQPS